jgi:hypothetical protein
MAHDALTRRSFFGATALAGAAVLVGRVRPAAAIRIEEANVETQALYTAACESQAAHQQLREELAAQLETAEGREKALALASAMNCPYCGCKLGAIEPYDAKF